MRFWKSPRKPHNIIVENLETGHFHWLHNGAPTYIRPRDWVEVFPRFEGGEGR